MNHLNSVLIEGITVSVGQLSGSESRTAIVFFIESARYTRLDGTPQKEVAQFEIHATNHLAETVSERLESGRGVRIIGRLCQKHHGPEKGSTFVMAEHVEIKPVFVPKEDRP